MPKERIAVQIFNFHLNFSNRFYTAVDFKNRIIEKRDLEKKILQIDSLKTK